MKTKNNASVGFNVASDIEKNAYDMGSEQNMQSVRLGFIRKVFVILTLQLILTFGIILILNVVEPINTFCKNEGGWLFWVTFIISFAMLWVLILLGLFTPFYMGTGSLIYSGLGALIFSLVSFLSFCRINLSIVPVSF